MMIATRTAKSSQNCPQKKEKKKRKTLPVILLKIL